MYSYWFFILLSAKVGPFGEYIAKFSEDIKARLK
jgi:hypothetical protein